MSTDDIFKTLTGINTDFGAAFAPDIDVLDCKKQEDKSVILSLEFAKVRFDYMISPAADDQAQIYLSWQKPYQYLHRKFNRTLITTVDKLAEELSAITAQVKEFLKPIAELTFSIVVPVHNREKLIEPLIESLNRQTLDKKNFEVIFVDDASTDHTADAIERLSRFNYRIIKRPIPSGAASTPRNEGIIAANGKYIYFVDSDDSIADYALQDFKEAVKDKDYDMLMPKFVFTNHKRKYQHEDEFSEVPKNIGVSIYDLAYIFHVFSHQLVYENNLFLNQSLIHGEDMTFTFNAYCVAQKVLRMDDRDYYFVYDHDGERLYDNGYRTDQLITSRLNNYWKYAYRVNCLNFIKNQEKKSKLFCLLLNHFIIEYKHWLIVERVKGINPNLRDDVRNILNLFKPYYFYINKKYFSGKIYYIANCITQ